MMIKTTLILAAAVALGACGGSRYSSSNAVTDTPYTGAVNTPLPTAAAAPVSASPSATTVPVVAAPVAIPFARGPIQQACQASDRKARSRARCGCIQAVANQKLSATDQRRGAKYWKTPGKLQEVRQSDNAGNERFWKAWKAYGQSAASVCKGT